MPETKAWGGTPAKNSRPTVPSPHESTGVLHSTAQTSEGTQTTFAADQRLTRAFLFVLLAPVTAIGAITIAAHLPAFLAGILLVIACGLFWAVLR